MLTLASPVSVVISTTEMVASFMVCVNADKTLRIVSVAHVLTLFSSQW